MRVKYVQSCWCGNACKDFSGRKTPNKFVFNLNEDNFTKSPFPFRGRPKPINLYDIKPYGKFSGEDTIKVFDLLRDASYLDIAHTHWDGFAETDDFFTRTQNLRYFDRIEDEKEKEKFIDYYCKVTGFPDLKKVSDNILDTLREGAYKSSKTLNLCDKNLSYQVVGIYYNPTCSVGKGAAFPGSDVDGGVIVLKGTSDPKADLALVERFKGLLWHNNDSRILSFNHVGGFPQVYTMSQIKALNFAICSKMSMFDQARASLQGDSFRVYNPNYIEANKFAIKLCGKFPDEKSDSFEIPSRERVKNFLFAQESIAYGEPLFIDPYNDCNLTTSQKKEALALCKEMNAMAIFQKNKFPLSGTAPCQIAALKSSSEKEKIATRRGFARKFKTLSTNDKYDFIKDMIRASCDEEIRGNNAKYFNSGEDHFAPLLRAMKNGRV